MINTDEDFDPICEMEFADTQTGKKVLVRLGPPTFDQERQQYYCVSEICGLEDGRRKRFHCDSPFEALMLSLQRFRVIFERYQGDLRDDTGSAPHMLFAKEIPWVYGSDVYQRLCTMVDNEVQKIEDERSRRAEDL